MFQFGYWQMTLRCTYLVIIANYAFFFVISVQFINYFTGILYRVLAEVVIFIDRFYSLSFS